MCTVSCVTSALAVPNAGSSYAANSTPAPAIPMPSRTAQRRAGSIAKVSAGMREQVQLEGGGARVDVGEVRVLHDRREQAEDAREQRHAQPVEPQAGRPGEDQREVGGCGGGRWAADHGEHDRPTARSRTPPGRRSGWRPRSRASRRLGERRCRGARGSSTWSAPTRVPAYASEQSMAGAGDRERGVQQCTRRPTPQGPLARTLGPARGMLGA